MNVTVPVGSCSISLRHRMAAINAGLEFSVAARPDDRRCGSAAEYRDNPRPAGQTGFTHLWPLYKIEHVFAQLGRWRRLSRCYEGSEASARAWLEVASVGYLAWRAAA